MVESELRKIFRRAKEREHLERERYARGGKPWHTYGSSIDCYQADFEELLQEDFQSLVDRIYATRGRCFIMDAFSDGEAIRGLEGLSGGLAITLADLRTRSQEKDDDNRNIRLIGGNIIDSRTVISVQEYLSQNRISGFDLILCRPLGGWTIVGETLKIQRFVANRLFHWLDPDEGLLFIRFLQGPENSLAVSGWRHSLKQAGIRAHADLDGRMKIVRSGSEPRFLPIM